MKRCLKIAIIGAQGYQRAAPQRIDCYSWHSFPQNLNLRDYDTVILNLLPLAEKPKVDWRAFETILNGNRSAPPLRKEGNRWLTRPVPPHGLREELQRIAALHDTGPGDRE